MRAGLITGKEQFELREVPDPEIRDGMAVVDIARCGICGSDVHAYAAGWPYAPGLCGHEWVGLVRAVSDDVTVVDEGDRVVGGIAPACGHCEACNAGHTQYCREMHRTFMGRGPLASPSGGFAPSIEVDARRLSAVPDSLDDVQGALVEPTTVAVHAVRRSKINTGDVVAVVGAGPIGLLTMQVARTAGGGHVVVVEPDEARRERALSLGADAAFAPGAELDEYLRAQSGGLGADIAFDCAGVPQTLQASVDLVRRGGSVCMVGVADGEATVRPGKWMSKEVSVDTSLAYTHEEFDMVTGLIADGRLRVRELHDQTVTLDELGATIDDMAHHRRAGVKILVDPTAG